MRWVGGLCALIMGAAWVAPLAAQTDETCTNPNALGVSRTVEIDTRGGPWLGTPHGNPDLLKPGEVVLTFDDGPIPLTTGKILAALAAECTKATFFMVGRMAAAYPDMVRQVAAAGHTVGTHTWSHPNLAAIAPARVQGQIEMAINAVQKAAGAPIAPFFRYPYLSSTAATVAYLRRRDIAQLAVDVDSLDYLSKSPTVVVRRTMAGLKARGRGIILLHDIHLSTAKAVPDLLARLREGGYRVVHLQPAAPVETIDIAEAPRAEKASAVQRPPRRRPKASATKEAEEAKDGGTAFDWLFK